YHALSFAKHYTLSLHDALPICHKTRAHAALLLAIYLERLVTRHHPKDAGIAQDAAVPVDGIHACIGHGPEQFLRVCTGFKMLSRSEEHTSELQSREKLVFRIQL